MKSTTIALVKRGYENKQLVSQFHRKQPLELIQFLGSPIPQERTAAAKVLGHLKVKLAITPLCKALGREKALYSKLAISEALGNFGTIALPELIQLLGCIGKNQHRTLPVKSFQKNSYPLPRDIAARIIIRTGITALPSLEKVLKNGNQLQITEAIDAIGHIAFYSHDQRSLDHLLSCLEHNRNDDIIVWKLIRAFGAFPNSKTTAYLEKIKDTSKNPTLAHEAKRSLRQLSKNNKHPHKYK